ncbi:VCBS domain-containing protein [Hoeflea alexandrii]|uniref:VCBS domain-containing protein n=1 Tax=Hoeflea alexandrii TaxID=288436 RepID=UPI0035CFB622
MRCSPASASTRPAGSRSKSTTAAGGSIDWTYQVGNEAVDILASGEVITLSFDVQINDGIFIVTQTVTITVTGTNDQPVIEGTSVLAGTITEQTDTTGAATSLTATGQIVLSDVDLTDTHTASQSFVSAVWSAGANPTADPGALVVNALNQSADTADWTYTVADTALDFLSAGETLTITYDVIVQDDSGTGTAASAVSQIVVTITGTNDAPVIDVTAGASSSELVEFDALACGCHGVRSTDIHRCRSVRHRAQRQRRRRGHPLGGVRWIVHSGNPLAGQRSARFPDNRRRCKARRVRRWLDRLFLLRTRPDI